MSEAQHSFEFVLNVRTQYVGHVTFPCLPAAAGLYLLRLDEMFRLMGRALNSDERRQLAETLENHLRMGYARAGDANLRIDYEMHPDRSLKRNLAIRMTLSTPDLATQFKTWNSGDDDHPFGKHPDARVTAVVRALPMPTPVLEIGGGTGRNALPIARLGYPVDVVELTEEFSRAMTRRAEAERLPIRVRWGNALDESLELPVGHYGLMFASEVVSHFRFDGSLRRFLERGVRALRPGGLLLFNIFLRCPNRNMSPTRWPGKSPSCLGRPCFRGRIWSSRCAVCRCGGSRRKRSATTSGSICPRGLGRRRLGLRPGRGGSACFRGSTILRSAFAGCCWNGCDSPSFSGRGPFLWRRQVAGVDTGPESLKHPSRWVAEEPESPLVGCIL